MRGCLQYLLMRIPARRQWREHRVLGQRLLCARGIVSGCPLRTQKSGLFRARPFVRRLGLRSISRSSCTGRHCLCRKRTSCPCLAGRVWFSCCLDHSIDLRVSPMLYISILNRGLYVAIVLAYGRTSLFRLLVSVPTAPCFSIRSVDAPSRCCNRLAIDNPTAPPPITT